MKRFLLTCSLFVAIASFGQTTVYPEKAILASFDFEELPTDRGWRTYDLDGKSTALHGKPKGWYWTFEDISENGVCGATSLFIYDTNNDDFVTPVTIPANDWLFSPAVEIPQEGSYILQWDMRSVNDYSLEDYEIRVIEADLLDRLENSFTSNMTLAEVSDTLLKHSEWITSVWQEKNSWTTHTININKYRGKKVSFIWRYCSNHSSLIYLDNYKVVSQQGRSIDASMQTYPRLEYNYAQIPSFYIENYTSLQGKVLNIDTHELNRVKTVLTLYNSEDSPLYNRTFEQATLSVNKEFSLNDELTSDLTAQLIQKPYRIELTTLSENGNEDVQNIYKNQETLLTDSVLAWETGAKVSYSMSGNLTGKKIGQRFSISVPSTLTSVSVIFTEDCTADSTCVYIYEISEKGEFNIVAQSIKIQIARSTSPQTIPLAQPVELESGKTYFIAVEEPSGKKIGLGNPVKNCGRIAAEYSDKEGHWVELGYGYTFCIRANVKVGSYGQNVTFPAPEPSVWSVRVNGKQVMLKGNGRYQIINMTGFPVAQGELTYSQEKQFSLPAGIYVIRTDNKECIKIALY